MDSYRQDRLFNGLQYLGGLILAFGYLPQALQIIRTRSVTDLSLLTFTQVALGMALMEAYAFYLVFRKGEGKAFLVTNTVCLCMSVLIAVLILIFQ